MTQDEIIEDGKKLIAVFMGHLNTEGCIDYKLHEVYTMPVWLSSYHTSWDWLMPVIQRLRELLKEVVFVQNSNGTFMRGNGKTKSFFFYENGTYNDAAFKVVVNVIKWYNQQSKKNQFTN